MLSELPGHDVAETQGLETQELDSESFLLALESTGDADPRSTLLVQTNDEKRLGQQLQNNHGKPSANGIQPWAGSFSRSNDQRHW